MFPERKTEPSEVRGMILREDAHAFFGFARYHGRASTPGLAALDGGSSPGLAGQDARRPPSKGDFLVFAYIYRNCIISVGSC